MSWRTECKKKAKALAKEKRQEFLDYMWKGITIGEASKKAAITQDEGVGILDLNLKKATYLNRDSD